MRLYARVRPYTEAELTIVNRYLEVPVWQLGELSEPNGQSPLDHRGIVHYFDPRRDNTEMTIDDAVFPIFQFNPNGYVIPIVNAINRLLDAKADPLGVIGWWLDPNGRLAGSQSPYKLIGSTQESNLLQLALAVLED